MEIIFGYDTNSSESIDKSHKGKSLLYFPTDYVVFDLETTGLSTYYDEIIEIGARKYLNNEFVGEFNKLIKPTSSIDSFITELTGITNEMLSEADNIEKVLPEFIEFVGTDVLVGHNCVGFDGNFLYRDAYEKLDIWFSNDYIDTMRISKRLFKEESHHTLKDLTDRFGINYLNAHRAMPDVIATKDCLDYMKEYVQNNNIDTNVVFDTRKHRKHQEKKNADYFLSLANPEEFDEDNIFYGKHVCFTGTLQRYVRDVARQIVANIGGIPDKNVTKKTNFLVVGDTDYREKTNKMKDAEKNKLEGQDIEIITESDFYDFISE